MTGMSVAKKLLVKPGQHLALVNAPSHYAGVLGPLPEGVEVTDDLTGPVNSAHLFVNNLAELERLVVPVLAALPSDGLVWIAYRKGGVKAGTDINRDVLRETIETMHGWRVTTLVAIDDVWSAMRFRRVES